MIGSWSWNRVLIRVLAVGGIAAALATQGCGSPFRGKVLAALPVQGEPQASDWEEAVPLDLTVWMGNVHERPEVVAIDREVSHRSTPQCHHGPRNTPPVPVRLAALYNDEAIFVRARWKDATRDEETGRLVHSGGRWTAEPAADDGIALLWGEPGEGAFRCQRSCHMREVDVYDGGTMMRMAMRHDEGPLDLWRWRAGTTAPFGLADDMVVDARGKRGDEGQILPAEVPAGSLGAGTEGEARPAFRALPPEGREADVLAHSAWDKGRWEVTFRRPLVTDDAADRAFRAEAVYPFAVSVFDATRTEHHVAGDGFTMVLARRSVPDGGSGGGEDDPLDF